MCVHQSLIKNRKYSMTEKNYGIVPECKDRRQLNVWIPCKQCYICKKKKAREWRMRISEDIKVNSNAKIVTLTFNTESLKALGKLCKGVEGYELDNQICKLAVKRFRERWRKKYKKSPRHWLITELGHGDTEHVHMHGIIWEDSRYKLKGSLLDEIEKIWGYGFVGKGKRDINTGRLINYVNEKTASYFTKYVNKIDAMHPEYKQIVLTSAGIGANFIGSNKAKDNEYRGEKTNQLYQLDNGGALPMPEYFRKKLYTEEQREKLAGWYLDKNVMYLEGKEIDLAIGDQKIFAMVKALRQKNARMGYGNGSKNWERKRFENKRRKELHTQRFWEGKTKAEEKKHQEKYWINPKVYKNEDERFWLELITEAREKKSEESIRSWIRPNLRFDEKPEIIERIERLEIAEKKQKTSAIEKTVYRFHTMDSIGRIIRRFTYMGENLSDARIYAGKQLNSKEIKFSKIER